jgi:hypothetical protein
MDIFHGEAVEIIILIFAMCLLVGHCSAYTAAAAM